MKKLLYSFLLMLVVASLLLSACSNGEPNEFSRHDRDPIAVSSEAESVPDEESSEASEDTDEAANNIKVLYNSYSEKPYFAMVGTCTEGAVVTAECNGETVSSNSYKGWFSLRLLCKGTSAEVKLYESIDGEMLGDVTTLTVRPKTPGSEMWPVVTGGDFQFFFQKMLPDYQGKNIPGSSAFSGLTKRVSDHLAQLRKYNEDAEIIYLIVPASMTVYPELVPETYGSLATETRLTKTIDAINAGGGIAIDLQSIFAEHKDDEMPLYYKLDSHWSDYGAFVAYQALFEEVAKKFPNAAPRSADEFNWNPGYYESGDMTYYLAMSQSKVKEYAYYRTFNFEAPSKVTQINRYRSKTMLCYSDEVTWENTINTKREDLPSCVVIRDSYSTQIYDLIAERMNKTHYLGMWGYRWDQSLMASEKPDYVIYVVAEWNLDAIIYN